ncbi:MAG: TlpA family protein disulfide reductase [Prolixibacteraceae bacterium]|nr:TlpA family protein disulfide reductase [Prolixibacteraceae bacterium]
MRIITLLSILLIFFDISFAIEPEETDILKKGNKIPDFSLKLTDNKEVSISDYKGKLTLIVFFATWCKPCLEELPHIQNDIWNIYETNDNFRLLVIGRGHDNSEVKSFIENNKYTFPAAGDKDKSIFSLFAQQYIPRSYLIDRNGKVIRNTIGYDEDSFNELKMHISRELSKVQ